MNKAVKIFVFLTVVLLSVADNLPADIVKGWNFESDTQGWHATTASINVAMSDDSAIAVGSSSGIRIQGKSVDNGWNHALSEKFPLEGGRFYRLSCWMRVDILGPETPVPILKGEFYDADLPDYLWCVYTESYDGFKPGSWQRLSTEFRTPAGTESAALFIDNGAKSPQQAKLPMEFDVSFDDITIEAIEKLDVSGEYRMNKIPSSLEKARGIHPRIYLDDKSITDMRNKIKTTHELFWKEVLSKADSYVKRGPVAYTPEVAPRYPGDEGIGGFQQLWQRGVGDSMPYLAMAWLMTGDRKYLDTAQDIALVCCRYPLWGYAWMNGVELAASHQLFGLAILYDWCYDDLEDSAKSIIRETMIQRSTALYQTVASEKVWWPRTELYKLVWANWYRAYLSNHQWIPMNALAASGIALYGEVDDAEEWIALPLDKFRNVMASLGDDGASHEGASYFGYGVDMLLKFMFMARGNLDEDMFQHDWFRNTPYYRLYLSLPSNSWTPRNNVIDIGDSGRGNGPDYQLRALASVYQNSHAQWLANRIHRGGLGYGVSRWMNLLWYDPDLEAKSPSSLPTFRHFTDMGLYSARSGWNGDESLLVFKCGPYMGHKAWHEKQAVDMFDDADDQHVHPDANHFVLFGNGQWLIRDDTGHRSKWTHQHNTLTVDGQGQLGEGWWYFKGIEALTVKARPRITHSENTPDYDHITGDATEAYPASLGVKKFTRHLIYLKPDILIVADDIEVDRTHNLELRFHPEKREATWDGIAFLMNGKEATLRLETLTRDGVAMTAETLSAEGWHAKPDSMFTVRLTHTGRKWKNAVALSWTKAGSEPKKVTMNSEGDSWIFSAGDRKIALNLKSGKAYMKE